MARHRQLKSKYHSENRDPDPVPLTISVRTYHSPKRAVYHSLDDDPNTYEEIPDVLRDPQRSNQ